MLIGPYTDIPPKRLSWYPLAIHNQVGKLFSWWRFFSWCFHKGCCQPSYKRRLHYLCNELKNYCPVSGPCFLSKLVEWVEAKQLMSHINSKKLDNPTETALMSIKNEVHLSLAGGEPTALVVLDLSSAFDTTDQNTLLGYLKSWFGLSGTVLNWFVSYLSNLC